LRWSRPDFNLTLMPPPCPELENVWDRYFSVVSMMMA
jgi:hypothetical protein